jgi:hypothetical protein
MHHHTNGSSLSWISILRIECYEYLGTAGTTLYTHNANIGAKQVQRGEAALSDVAPLGSAGLYVYLSAVCCCCA